MIYRKLFRVKTVGSKQEGDLRPEWSGRLPPSISMVVHEYDYVTQTCVCECWGSDHPIRAVSRNMSDLEELAKDPCVVEVLDTHPSSPEVIGVLSLSGGHSPESVDKAKKKLTFKGKTMSYKRIKKHKTTSGEEEELFILDEG